MRISFDLDDTLICYDPAAPREPRLLLLVRLLIVDEPLRLGSRALMKELRHRGWELWIYTTSSRHPLSVALWLRLHGVRVDGVINDRVHAKRNLPEPCYRPPSKNPARFGIDLHVDDLEGVRIEGREHGFDVVIVSPDDPDWTERVLDAAIRCRNHC